MEPLRIWFDPPHVRWGRVAVTVVVVTALVGGWVAQRRGILEEAPVAAAVAKAASAAASGAPTVARPDSGAKLLAAAPTPAKAASSVEFYCGLRAVTVDPGDEVELKRIAEAEFEKLQAHRARVVPGWLEEMKSSADEQAQAAAWFLESTREATRRLQAGSTALPFDSLDELARLAQRSRDPLAYAWAYQACEMFGRQATNSACDGLNVQEWTQRDPGNAVPWLVAAGQSGLDAARRSAYLEKALAADTMRSTWGRVHAVLVKAVPTSEVSLDRSARLFEAFDIDAFVSTAQSNLIGHCGDAELRQGTRRHQCERLAAFLADKGDTLLAQTSAAAIGTRLGWSQDRLARLRGDRDGLTEVQMHEFLGDGCAGLARAEAYFADVAKYGEIGALRRRQQAAQATTTAAR